MKQEVARAHVGWALDKVALHNDVTKTSPENCKEPPKVILLIILEISILTYSPFSLEFLCVVYFWMALAGT